MQPNLAVGTAMAVTDYPEQEYAVDEYLEHALKNHACVLDVIRDAEIEFPESFEPWVDLDHDTDEILRFWQENEQEVDEIIKNSLDHPKYFEHVMDVICVGVNLFLIKQFENCLNDKLAAIRALHPGMPLWENGFVRKLTDEELVWYAGVYLGEQGSREETIRATKEYLDAL